VTTAVGGVKPAKMIAPRRGRRRVASDRHGPPDRRRRPRIDAREAAREQVESLGARFISPGEALKAQEAANGTRSKDKRHAVLQSYQTLPRIVQDGVGQFGIGHHPRYCQRADHCADHKFSVFFRDVRPPPPK